ncbi:hypothetical protein QQM41_03410 [Acetobacter sp. AC2005]|uniref:hypothetical protein n=1 Tax=Acetobacter sp. AC2005 TaxID=3134142 RepID=UPI0030D2BA12
MLGFRPVFLALGACTALLAAPPAAYAAEKNPHYGLQIMKMRPGPPPMTAATAAPGILDYDGIPTVLGTNAANVGGLMYFCYHNKLITDTTVKKLGRELSELPDVRASSDYAWGGIGMLRLGPDQMFDTRTLNRDQREAVCSRTALMGPDLLKAARNGDAAPGIDNQRASDEKPRWPSEPPPPIRAPVATAAAVPAGVAATHRVSAPAPAVSAPVAHVAAPRPAVSAPSAPAYVAPRAVAATPHVAAPSAPAPQVVSAPPPAVMAPTPAPAPKPVPYTPLPSQQAIQDEVAQKAEAREAAAQAEFARQAAAQAGAVR